MREKLRFLDSDFHAETIAAAIAKPNGEVKKSGNDSEPLGISAQAFEEAGPTGYVLYWQWAELGVQCEVRAP
jgi:transposase